MEPRREAGRPQEAGADELVITRTFDAPRALVFRAWTDPQHLKEWWGPTGFTAPTVEVDAREGGVMRGCMRSPEGKDFWSTGRFVELKPPEKLVVTDSFADEHGNVVDATHYGMSEQWPREALITVLLAEEGGKTRMTLRHSIPPSTPGFEDCRQGWQQSFDKLEDHLKRA